MAQKLSDTLVKVIDRSNPMMQNLQLAHKYNKLAETGGSVDLEENKEVSLSGGVTEIVPSAGNDGMKKVTATVKLETKILSVTDINNNTEITPRSGNAGFNKIKMGSMLQAERVFTGNGTYNFGDASNPFFPRKVVIDVPSDFIAETISVGASDDPIVIDCTDKKFVSLMTSASTSNGKGITTEVSNANKITVNISQSGQTAGTMVWDGAKKTLTYTPNASFPMGATQFFKVVI